MKADYKIIIADDHQLICSAIEQIITDNFLNTKIVKVHDGKQVLEKLNSFQANLIILDINMPKLNGLETAEIILSRYPNMKILVVSQNENNSLIKKLKDIGVKGYLPKTFEQELLIEAIYSIQNDELFFPLSEIKNDILKDKYNLTVREIEVIYLIIKGMNTKEIATSLDISAYTVDTHRKNISRKTGAKTPVNLILLLDEMGVSSTDF